MDQHPGRRISDELLETFIRQYIEGQDGEQVVFSWQGGEPTLLGIDFFRKVVELEKKYKKANQRIENDLQTNGTLLNEEWCQFLHQNNFLVGLVSTGQGTFIMLIASPRAKSQRLIKFLPRQKC